MGLPFLVVAGVVSTVTTCADFVGHVLSRELGWCIC